MNRLLRSPPRARLTSRGYLVIIAVGFLAFNLIQLSRRGDSDSPVVVQEIPSPRRQPVEPLQGLSVGAVAPEVPRTSEMTLKEEEPPTTRVTDAPTTKASKPLEVRTAVSKKEAETSPFTRLELGTEMQMEAVTDDSFCFSVATVPRPWYKDGAMPELKDIQLSSISSWINAGAGEILWLTEEEGDYDVGRLNLEEKAAEKCRTVPGLKAEMKHIPLIDSAFKLADKMAKCEFVVFMNTDIFVLPSFGGVLKSVVRSMADVDRFLFVGHRIRVSGKPADTAKIVLTADERKIQEKWVVGATQPNPHATDVFVWRRGSYQNVPIPPFLIGRNIWDLWLWSYAVRRWKSIQGGNVFFVFHPDHAKPHQNMAEYRSNIERANRDKSEPVTCSNIDCAGYFLYAGKCRPVESGSAKWLGKDFCLRRKLAGPGFPPPKEEKLPLSLFQFSQLAPEQQ